MSTFVALFTLIFGLFSGYILNIIATRISFKQRTIDNKIKVYDALIVNWVETRNHIFHSSDTNKWLELDKLYGRSQTFIGEAFLVSDDLQLLEDINSFNEKFIRTNWHELSIENINQNMENLKTEGINIIQRMKADIHESTKFTFADLSYIFKDLLINKV